MLVALLGLSSWCLMIVLWLFLAVPWVSLQSVVVVFPDHTHLLFLPTMIGLTTKHAVRCKPNDSTYIFKAEPGNLDIRIHGSGILF